jgi:hypothetical protein
MLLSLTEASQRTSALTGRSTWGGADALDDDIVAALQQLIEQDPGRSMGLLLRELGFRKKSVRNKMKLKSITRSTLSKGQLIMRPPRRGGWPRPRWCSTSWRHLQLMARILSSDENKNRDYVQTYMRFPVSWPPKLPATAMVLGFVSNKGDNVPPLLRQGVEHQL